MIRGWKGVGINKLKSGVREARGEGGLPYPADGLCPFIRVMTRLADLDARYKAKCCLLYIGKGVNQWVTVFELPSPLLSKLRLF